MITHTDSTGTLGLHELLAHRCDATASESPEDLITHKAQERCGRSFERPPAAARFLD